MLNRIETMNDLRNNDNIENKRLTNFKKGEKSSPNIFRKPIKVYKKNVKLAFSRSSKNYKTNPISTTGNERERYKNIKQNNKVNSINIEKMNNCLKIRSNFNYDKLNELCHKINFDLFNKK